MVISLNLVPKDYLRFGTVVQKRYISRSSNATTFIGVSVGLLICAFVFGFKDELLHHMIIAAAPLGIFLIFIVGVFVIAQNKSREMILGMNGLLVGTIEMTLDPDFFRIRSRKHTTTVQWSGICDFIDDTEHFYLMMDRLSGFVIPKRCFNSPEQIKEFVLFVESKYAKPPAEPINHNQ